MPVMTRKVQVNVSLETMADELLSFADFLSTREVKLANGDLIVAGQLLVPILGQTNPKVVNGGLVLVLSAVHEGGVFLGAYHSPVDGELLYAFFQPEHFSEKYVMPPQTKEIENGQASCDGQLVSQSQYEGDHRSLDSGAP